MALLASKCPPLLHPLLVPMGSCLGEAVCRPLRRCALPFIISRVIGLNRIISSAVHSE